MKILIMVMLLFGCFFTSLLNAENGPWQLRKDQEGIEVYTRKVEGSPILEYKANVIIHAPTPKVIALFENEKLISSWYYQCVHSELVDNEAPDHKVVYLSLHLPWPVTARDVIFKITKTDGPINRTTNYHLSALPDRLPRVKGMIRVPFLKTLWAFKSLPQGKTEVFFQQYSDPGGFLPSFLVNELAVDTPYYSLKNFRKLVTGNDR